MKPELQLSGHIATLTLRRPDSANKLSPEDLPSIIESIDQINAADAIRVVVLRSEGKYFCSGYDISEVKNSQHKGSSFGEMVDAIEQCRAVTIAAVQGGVYGGATDMALAMIPMVPATIFWRALPISPNCMISTVRRASSLPTMPVPAATKSIS